MRHWNTTHGHTPSGNHSPTYISWRSMLMRCYQKGYGAYPNYGGRGIKVCRRWRLSFSAFLADLGPRPSRAYQLDRIDGRGHYIPGNVRWATLREQALNRCTTRLATVFGRTECVKEWERLTGTVHTTILQRLNYGWSPEDAVCRLPDVSRHKRLTPAHIIAIRRLAARGRTHESIGPKYGVHPWTISNIVARRTHVHV